MKTVRVCLKPRICEYLDKWSVPTGEHYVHFPNGDISEGLYRKIVEFEDFPYEAAIKGEALSNEEFKKQVDKLLSYTNGYQCLQYNARFSKEDKNGNVKYIRMIAALGVKQTYLYSLKYQIKYNLLRIKCFFINLFRGKK